MICVAAHCESSLLLQDAPEHGHESTAIADTACSEASGAGGQAEDSSSDGEAFGVRELTVSVRTGRNWCKSSASSTTAVTSTSRDSGDSDAEEAIDAITNALRRSRPPSSAARR